MEGDDLTNAILFDNARGSGREVTVSFLDAGIELASIAGEQIAVWPYGSIESLSRDFTVETAFRLNRHEILTLQVFDKALSDEILARAPMAKRAARQRFFDKWMPVEIGALLYLGLAAAVIALIGFLARLWGRF
jgi:hypothetical protein